MLRTVNRKKLLLWLSDEGEESRVMKSKESSAVYSLDGKWTDRLRQLVGNACINRI